MGENSSNNQQTWKVGTEKFVSSSRAGFPCIVILDYLTKMCSKEFYASEKIKILIIGAVVKGTTSRFLFLRIGLIFNIIKAAHCTYKVLI